MTHRKATIDDLENSTKIAIKYFWQDKFNRGEHPEASSSDYHLNKELQYLFCTAFKRIFEEFGEVSHKDIVLLCESWIMSQGCTSKRSLIYQQRWYEQIEKEQ